jgi:hypothetical protein
LVGWRIGIAHECFLFDASDGVIYGPLLEQGIVVSVGVVIGYDALWAESMIVYGAVGASRVFSACFSVEVIVLLFVGVVSTGDLLYITILIIGGTSKYDFLLIGFRVEPWCLYVFGSSCAIIDVVFIGVTWFWYAVEVPVSCAIIGVVALGKDSFCKTILVEGKEGDLCLVTHLVIKMVFFAATMRADGLNVNLSVFVVLVNSFA